MKKIIDEVIKWNKECKPSYETCLVRGGGEFLVKFFIF